jgi:hypothetical protein
MRHMYNNFIKLVAGMILWGEEAGMASSVHSRKKLVAFLCVLALSSITMLWLFWRCPLPTAIITVAALAGLAVCARLARAVDATEIGDLDRGSQLQ